MMYGNFLCGYGTGSAIWPGPWLVAILLAILAGLFISLVRRSPHPDRSPSTETALEILARRYAAGDMGEQEYLTMKKNLEH